MNKLNTILAAGLIAVATTTFAAPGGNNGNGNGGPNAVPTMTINGSRNFSNSTVFGVTGTLGKGRATTLQATQSTTRSGFKDGNYISRTTNVGEGYGQSSKRGMTFGGFNSNVGNNSTGILFNIRPVNQPRGW